MTKHSLLATDLLYKPLGHESFDAVKKTFFEQQSDYFTKTPAEKWTWLRNEFCNIIPQAGIQSVLSKFMDKRQHTSSENEYVLSQQQCLDYIERFYFLYRNDDPVFRLNVDTKASFISLMQEAITNNALCETGRFVRFEQLIMEFRTDKNWLDNVLQQHRYSVLTALQEAYNRENAVYRGMHVHTLGVMQRFAHEKKLGINQLYDLRDVHMNAGLEQQIKAYFDKQYLYYFEEYENNAIKNLSEYILLKMGALLHENQVDISQWQAREIALPNGYNIQLMPTHDKLTPDRMEKDTIYLYLQEVYLKGEQIWGVTHCGEPFPIIEPFKKIEPSANERESAIHFEEIKQLLREGKKYTLPDSLQEQLIISSLSERGGRSYYSVNNAFFKFLSDHLHLTDIADIKSSFFNEADEETWILKSRTMCLSQIEYYVEQHMLEQQYFISSAHYYDEHFDFQTVLVRFKNGLTLDNVKQVSQRLTQQTLDATSFAVELNQEQTKLIILKNPWILFRNLKNNFHLLTTLPSAYKSNYYFMSEVMHFFCAKITRLLSEKNNDLIIHLIMPILFEIVGEETNYFASIPDELRHHEVINPIITAYQQQCIKNKDEIMHRLRTSSNISLPQLVQSTQSLSPQEVSRVIQNRPANINPLPYCQNPLLFNQFCQELGSSESWINYLNYKQNIISKKSDSPAAAYLLATEYWFLAYMRYQHHYSYFDSRYDVEMHLQQILYSLHDYFNVFIPLLLMGTMFTISFSIADCIIPNGNKEHFINLEVCTYAKKSLGSNSVGVLLVLASPFIFITAYAIEHLKNNPFPTNSLKFTEETKRFFLRIRGTLTDKSSQPLASDLLTRCEDSICRLLGMDNLAAHQKADLLKSSLHDIKKEPNIHQLADSQIAQRLQENYPLSFWKIASQKRYTAPFELAMNDNMPNHLTTTSKHISAAPFSQWFGSKNNAIDLGQMDPIQEKIIKIL